jgi:hypothetical protein
MLGRKLGKNLKEVYEWHSAPSHPKSYNRFIE